MFSQKCIDIIKKYEGFSTTAYPDPKTRGAPWTIGYGFTTVKGRLVQKGDVMSVEEADEHFPLELAPYNLWVKANVKVPLNQNQEDALTCWVYNIGPTKAKKSTALKLLNAGEYEAAGRSMTLWISPGTRVERGLRKRRQEELALFLSEA